MALLNMPLNIYIRHDWDLLAKDQQKDLKFKFDDYYVLCKKYLHVDKRSEFQLQAMQKMWIFIVTLFIWVF